MDVVHVEAAVGASFVSQGEEADEAAWETENGPQESQQCEIQPHYSDLISLSQ